MQTTGAHHQYRETTVSQADPITLVALLYSGALRFVKAAELAIEESSPEAAHNAILRAYAIIAELMATLDHEQGGEISRGLEQCYDFMLYQLREADIAKDARPLGEVAVMLQQLSEAWKQAFSSGAGSAGTPQENAAGGFDLRG
jgi:flagellar protein FliS